MPQGLVSRYGCAALSRLARAPYRRHRWSGEFLLPGHLHLLLRGNAKAAILSPSTPTSISPTPSDVTTRPPLIIRVASALAGGDCIDDADALRAGGTLRGQGAIHPGEDVRQLDRVSRQLLARAWAAGAGPGDSPLTIDLDSTICETYGLAKEGARHHGYTGARGYHPLLAIAAGTGEVLMSRLREGRANTARGAAHFLRETVGRVRYGGARGQLTSTAIRQFLYCRAYAIPNLAHCR